MLCSAFRPALPFAAILFGAGGHRELLNLLTTPRRSLHILKAHIEGVLIVGYYLLVIFVPLKNVQRVGVLPLLVRASGG